MRQRFVSGVDFFLFFYVVDSNFISFLFFFFCSSVVDSAFLFFSFLFQLCDALERSRQTKAPTVFLLFFVSVSKLFFNNFFLLKPFRVLFRCVSSSTSRPSPIDRNGRSIVRVRLLFFFCFFTVFNAEQREIELFF